MLRAIFQKPYVERRILQTQSRSLYSTQIQRRIIMPLPLILGIGAAAAGVTGIILTHKGHNNNSEAENTVELVKARNIYSNFLLEEKNKSAIESMDKLGELELKVIDSFLRFSDIIEKIQLRPTFAPISINNNTELPHYSTQEIRLPSIGARRLLEGLAGAGVGVAAGFAAASAIKAAVVALGTASTGNAISTLSGIALTNATLAALGGGTLAIGGGGIILGKTVLEVSALGIGLLAGGAFCHWASNINLTKAKEAENQIRDYEIKINAYCELLQEIQGCAENYHSNLLCIYNIYIRYLSELESIIIQNNKTDWTTYSQAERNTVETCSKLVTILYNMCKVNIVEKSDCDNELNKVNYNDINEAKDNATFILDQINIYINSESDNSSNIDSEADDDDDLD